LSSGLLGRATGWVKHVF